MVKPMLGDMTKSELHAVMTGGFATIAGSVLATYILFGVSVTTINIDMLSICYARVMYMICTFHVHVMYRLRSSYVYDHNF